MILFLTLIWIAGLALAVKLGVVKLNLWWKLSPLFWSLFLLVTLFIPLQFWAPSGSMISGNPIIAISPQVSGEVVEVYAEANVRMAKGELLFSIDDTRYAAALDNAAAAVQLANIRLEQELQLSQRGVGKALDLDRAQAQLSQKNAQYDRAKFDLDSTRVVAPTDGYATNVTVRPGATAVTLPLSPSIVFVDSSETHYAGFVMQNHLRFIEPGQPVEVTLKMYPGRIFTTEVDYVVPARATGFEARSAVPVVGQEIVHGPYAVQLRSSPELEALALPAGASGRMAIYSGAGGFAHVIRKVDIRIESIINFINPF